MIAPVRRMAAIVSNPANADKAICSARLIFRPSKEFLGVAWASCPCPRRVASCPFSLGLTLQVRDIGGTPMLRFLKCSLNRLQWRQLGDRKSLLFFALIDLRRGLRLGLDRRRPARPAARQ